jgi:2-deoxystreptamine N-acetyl-D-glucosaminyltransferase/2-deoxystreptamine glucosyltransferase
MQTRVTLLGAQTEAAVRDQLMHAHLFVLASRMGEAMPVVLIEALAMGVPAVATDVGGTKELIRDGTTGLLVPPGSVPALADAMHRLATQPELALRCSAAGRELVAADYASDRSARTIAAALPRVAAGFVR